MNKIAVVLFNLGGPDRPEAVEPFLFNLFNDPAIITLPQPLRWLVAKLVSIRRAPVAREIYAALGGGSPILPHTQAQADALAASLNARGGDAQFGVFIAMRYWHPFAAETARAVAAFAPDRIVLLPLYPQFSTTTTASSVKDWAIAARDAGVNVPTQTICCYPDQAGLVRAMAATIRPAYDAARRHGTPRLLLSAHGLPEKIVRGGDPYPLQCRQTAAAVIAELALPELDVVLCYQSRVGPLAWIKPATDDEVRRAGRDRVPLVVAPLAFVSDHSETLVEIDIEYRKLATESGVPFFASVPAVGIAPDFIAGLDHLVRRALAGPDACMSGSGRRICPPEVACCPCRAGAV